MAWELSTRPEGLYHPFSASNQEPPLLSYRILVYNAELLARGSVHYYKRIVTTQQAERTQYNSLPGNAYQPPTMWKQHRSMATCYRLPVPIPAPSGSVTNKNMPASMHRLGCNLNDCNVVVEMLASPSCQGGQAKCSDGC